MTLGTLVISIAVAALILTFIMGLGMRKVNNWMVSYLQNFAGALFVFSGWVKAIDPLGTAFKLEQYFAEFESVFQETWFSFLSPLFPWLNDYAVSFSVLMIVFEIVLGLMLLIGAARKFTAWAFFLLVGFFTFLTGFTYLTGYVPEGVNFFQFGQWGPYVETNMKVTDCGCFGDFLKLEPKISFLKDVVLLIPAILFVLMNGQMHQLFSKGTRAAVILVSAAGLTLYCFSNFVWDLPHTDFRPFKEGADIRERKALEEEAQLNIEILAYRMTNKETGEVVELPYQEYLKEFKKYPSEEWELEQIQSEPEVERTKISDFDVSDAEGNNVTEDILSYPDYSFMIVAYKLYGDTESTVVTVKDTLYEMDTLRTADTVLIQPKAAGVEERQETREVYTWEEDYLQPWKESVNPVMEEALEENVRVYAITAYADPSKIDDFRFATDSNYPFYQADDILLKTIIRSNPGVVLMKDGKIIAKWHHKQLPGWEKIQSKFME